MSITALLKQHVMTEPLLLSTIGTSTGLCLFTADNVTPSSGVDLLVFWPILPPDVGALHPHEAQHKPQHAHRKTCDQQGSDHLEVACSHNETQTDMTESRRQLVPVYL